MNLKGSKTEKNLQDAFAGESMARNKYTYFASQAAKDGFVEIQKVFEETADNEKEHAKLWFKHLNGGAVPKTAENLIAAAAGEHGEWFEMYKRMAKEAKEEGFDQISAQFAGVAAIEKMHEERYLAYLKAIQAEPNALFNSKEKAYYICQNCGLVHFGNAAPEVCPVCQHPKAFFKKI